MQDNQRFAKGLEIRREVLGNEYVDNNLAGSNDFMMTFQRIVTELAWGYAGTAPRSTGKLSRCSASPYWRRADVSRKSRYTPEVLCGQESH
jgi:hypothetical protein